FYERLAEKMPTVMVFEDIHWADSALLDFIEHLLEWSRAKPIFVLALTRPELLERRPDFGAHGRSATRLVLEPLSDGAMNALLDGLVPGLPDEVRAQIRDRADGIPLYAVETVRMLLDRGALDRDGDALRVVGPLDRIDVPETLHALIAARLDGLTPEERELIQHAAVLGKTFGARGLAALGDAGDDAVAPILERLVRKELLTIDLDPRSPERGQYGFLQALVQRVAYDTLAKRERGRLHRAAAAYLETEAGIDPDEIAEVIAAHHRDAYEADASADSRAAACAWLERAARRAAALGAPDDGQRAYDDAAAIAEEPAERARLLEEAGKLAIRAGRMADAEERLHQSVETFTAAGNTHAAARAASFLGLSLWNQNRADEALGTLRPAFEALAGEEHDVDVGNLAAELARIEFFAGERQRGLEHVELALDVAEQYRDLGLLSQALNTKSLLISPSRLHERHALLREALRIAEEHDLGEQQLRAINNLLVVLEASDRPAEGSELLQQGLAIARARGHRAYLTWFGSAVAGERIDTGDWDGAFALAEDVLPDGVQTFAQAIGTALILALASFERGDDDAARAWLARAPADLAGSADKQIAAGARYAALIDACISGSAPDAVAEMVAAWEMSVELDIWSNAGSALACAADAASLLGDPVAAAPLVDLYDEAPVAAVTRYMRANAGRIRGFRAAAAGDEDAAADSFAEALAAARSWGRDALVAKVLADYGVWLAGSGRGEEAEPLLEEARTLFERMRAARWLARIDVARPLVRQ
ncbi:MAG TPA: hypothetical protein VFU10_13865, partial [Gaiellaceae bacterium]|nr:hypothetical protein [Gaiellaceae bacterium]